MDRNSMGSALRLACLLLVGSGPAGWLPPACAADGPAAQPASKVELDPLLLAPVQHRTAGIRPAEGEAYYKILAHARDVDYQAQQAAAERNFARHEREFRANPKHARQKFSLFGDIFRHPEQYTGELVTLHGYIRKLDSSPADDENQHGLKTLYEAWMYTDDSQRNPCVIVCSEIPPGIPQGQELAREGVLNGISMTGYFFKMYIYHAQDGGRVAPLFIARRLEWNPPPTPAAGPPLIYVFPALAAGFGLLIWILWRGNRRDRRLAAERQAKAADFNINEVKLLAADAEAQPFGSDHPV